MAQPNVPPVVLLGAGASVPAGLPDVDTLTHDFELHLDTQGKDLREAFTFLKQSIQSNIGRFDVELLLQALTELTEKSISLIQYFHGDLKKETRRLSAVFPSLRTSLKHFVRAKCQEAGDVEYLRPLIQSLSRTEQGLDIFTLNYDPTIETLCEVDNVPYTDGFSPYWEPRLLQDQSFQVRLFKIHGSVFWFYRGPGHFVKVPVKGVVDNLKFFTGEDLSELLIYPALEKKLDAGPYPYILNALREKLASSDLLIVIGYSFRDANIRNLVLEQMRANPDLWMMLVSRSADSRKAALCKEAPALDARIVSFNGDSKIFIGHRELGEAVSQLRYVRTNEEQTRISQASRSDRDDPFWIQCIQAYRRLRHYSRIREIGEELLFGQYEPGSFEVERELFDLSLRFGIDQILRGDKNGSLRWLTFFRDCCVSLDLATLNNLPNASPHEQSVRETLQIRLGLPPEGKGPLWRIALRLDSLKDDLDYVANQVHETEGSVNKQLEEVLRTMKSLDEALSFTPMPREGPNEYRKRVADITNTTITDSGGFYTAADELVGVVKSRELPTVLP